MTTESDLSVPEVASRDGAESTQDVPGVKLYNMEDLAKHASYKDCWLLIDGKVYDVTKFMDEHPGGDEVMLSSTGKDAGEDFEDVGHSTSAREQLKAILIGEIDPASAPPAPVHTSVSVHQKTGTNKVMMTILQILVPIAILALAIAVRILTKKDTITVQ